MKAECPHGGDVAAYCAGELSLAEQAGFSAHLEDCPECRNAVAETRHLLVRLRSVPEAESERDFAPAILARIHTAQEKPPRWPYVAAVAAVLAVLAAAFAFRESPPPVPAAAASIAQESRASVARALDWLVQAQEADGSWNAERWGGQRNYTIALTALPLMALSMADEHTAARDSAVVRAAASLLRSQNPDGTFGPVFQGAPYNHSIATLALLHAWKSYPQAVEKSAIDRALIVLIERQTPEGAWGYRHGFTGDRSITQWHLQTLEFAASLGWENARFAAERGWRWIATHARPLSGSEEPDDSTSVMLARATGSAVPPNGNLDFYQAYFTAAALKHEDDTVARKRLANLREEILRHQITEGMESGSWPPDDQWGVAGGRLYSTALASLSLQKE